MDKTKLNEATLTAPTFTGSEAELAQATSAWSSVISTLSYLNGYGLSSYPGEQTLSAENKKAIISALICHLNCKMDEINNVTPPVVPQTAPVPVPQVAAVAVAPTAPTEIEFSYAEGKKPAAPIKESVNPIVKRMRELAGIPHEANHV